MAVPFGLVTEDGQVTADLGLLRRPRHNTLPRSDGVSFLAKINRE